MRAEIVSVGTEILLGQIVDSNAAILGELFAELGIEHVFRQTVGDNLPRLTEVLRHALSRSDIVVTIGGLGPTNDDLTRDGIAAALDSELMHDPAIEDRLRELFAARNLTYNPAQNRQAMRPECADAIPNPNGTAPGLIARKGEKTVIALPGPRMEFAPMVRGPIRETLMHLGDGSTIQSRVLRVCGMGESMVERTLGEIMNQSQPTVAPYAKPNEVHLRVTAKAPTNDQAMRLIDKTEADIRAVLGDLVYGVDEESLESVVLRLAEERGLSVGTVESCTGGAMAQRLSSVDGASKVFAGGLITYSALLKMELADVPKDVIEQYGTISEECAKAMAVGGLARLQADLVVAITGIAGKEPVESKLPGTVWIAMASAAGVTANEFRFGGSREIIQTRAAHTGLIQLRKTLMQI